MASLDPSTLHLVLAAALRTCFLHNHYWCCSSVVHKTDESLYTCEGIKRCALGDNSGNSVRCLRSECPEELHSSVLELSWVESSCDSLLFISELVFVERSLRAARKRASFSQWHGVWMWVYIYMKETMMIVSPVLVPQFSLRWFLNGSWLMDIAHYLCSCSSSSDRCTRLELSMCSTFFSNDCSGLQWTVAVVLAPSMNLEYWCCCTISAITSKLRVRWICTSRYTYFTHSTITLHSFILYSHNRNFIHSVGSSRT